MVLLTNWRFFAFAGGCGFAWILDATWHDSGKARVKLLNFLCYLGVLILGFFVPFLVVLFTLFHGNFSLYFLHFFGFFMPDSGLGDWTGYSLRFFPEGASWAALAGRCRLCNRLCASAGLSCAPRAQKAATSSLAAVFALALVFYNLRLFCKSYGRRIILLRRILSHSDILCAPIGGLGWHAISSAPAGASPTGSLRDPLAGGL